MKDIKRRLFIQEKKKTIVPEEKEDKTYKVGFGPIKPVAIDPNNSNNLKVNKGSFQIDSLVLKLKGTV